MSKRITLNEQQMKLAATACMLAADRCKHLAEEIDAAVMPAELSEKMAEQLNAEAASYLSVTDRIMQAMGI